MAEDPTSKADVPKLPFRGGAFARAVAAGKKPLEAALKAGFTEDRAEKAAERLLGDPRVRALIRVIRLKEIDAAAILLELGSIGFLDPADLVDKETGAPLALHDIPAHVRRAIASVKVTTTITPPSERMMDDGNVTVGGTKVTYEYEAWNKPKALELLGRAQALFKDKLEVSGALTLDQLVPKRKPAG